MIVRAYTDLDAEAVHWLHEHAFDGLDEADLVQAIHDDGAAVLSQVAERDGTIIGHILYSPLDILPAPVEPKRLAALAPVAVLPDVQRQGVGEALIQQSLEALRADGWDGVIVLGHPAYYPKFGFVAASTFGIAFPTPVPEEAFMALPLREGGMDGCAGELIYHKAFKLGGL